MVTRRQTVFAAGMLVVLIASVADASQVQFQEMEKTAGQIKTILKVRVFDVKRSQTHMKLKSGGQGPVTSMHVDYTCQITEVVLGKWAGKIGKITIRHSTVVPIKYDENGKAVMRFSFILSGSGIESDLKKGKEYLACFALIPDPAREKQYLYAAYPLENRQGLLAAVGDAAMLVKFRKALTKRLPKGWMIQETKYGKHTPFGWKQGPGAYIMVYDHKAPIVAGRRAPWTDVHIWIMARDYKAKAPKVTRSTARQIGAWRGRRVLIMGGQKRWPDNRRDISAAFKASGDPVRTAPIKPDYKLAKKIAGDLAAIEDYRKRREYTLELFKNRPAALAGLVALLERGAAPVRKPRRELLWEYAATQLMAFDDPQIAAHLAARLARSKGRCSSHRFVPVLARFRVKSAVPYLVRWLRQDGAWEVKYDMFGAESSYLLAALDRIAGARLGPADQVRKAEFYPLYVFYEGLERDQVMPKVEQWWAANKAKWSAATTAPAKAR